MEKNIVPVPASGANIEFMDVDNNHTIRQTNVRELDTLSAILYKGNNFCDFVFTFTSEKGSSPKGNTVLFFEIKSRLRSEEKQTILK